MQWLTNLFPNVAVRADEFFQSIVETLIMVGITGVISFVLSLVIGVLLLTTRRGGLLAAPVFNQILGWIVNILRSVPFIILAAALVPITRIISGTALGVQGAIFPLVVGITPFFSRQIESAFLSVDPGLVEAAVSMGLSPAAIIWRVYFREAIPSIAKVTTITIVSLIGLTAISGSLGGGGLGDFAIRFGYQQFMLDATIASVIVLLIMVGFVEFVGRTVIDATTHQ
ncbi:methionine ABC transporter permease [Bifidobacterium breve]|uniref:methionine ABC transporter permease n=2 Tax=Bifidobacterium breve TaxID=1685 RepID=UPI0026477AFF|nr:methionine ABC transporter permease [Bifidobacterium breve]MDO8168989.1 methionine ABC transporter permease [Bifidobacterium breve]